MIDERAMSSSPLMPSEVKGLYKTLRKHPVLMNRRLQVGETKPPLYPPFIDYTIKTEVITIYIHSDLPEIFETCADPEGGPP